MDRSPLPHSEQAGQRGFALVEVLASAAILLVCVAGTLGLIQRATATSVSDNARSTALGLAHRDVERLRHFSADDLSSGLAGTTSTTVGAITYTTVSSAQWVADQGGTPDCTTDQSQAQYLRLSSTVTWPDMGNQAPVVAETLFAPPVTALSPTNGTLALHLETSTLTPVSGVLVTITGPETHSAATDANGCVIFALVPAGTYAATYTSTGWVDPDGQNAVSKTVGVSGGVTSLVTQQYDRAASVTATFQNNAGLGWTAASARRLSASAPGASAPLTFGSATPASSITADALFPFSSGYGLYAGDCEGSDPSRYDPDYFETVGSHVSVSPGAVSAPVVVRVPTVTALVLRLGLVLGGATVMLKPDTSDPSMTGCDATPIIATTNALGIAVLTPPLGSWLTCADNGSRHVNGTLALQSPAAFTITLAVPTLGSAGVCS